MFMGVALKQAHLSQWAHSQFTLQDTLSERLLVVTHTHNGASGSLFDSFVDPLPLDQTPLVRGKILHPVVSVERSIFDAIRVVLVQPKILGKHLA